MTKKDCPATCNETSCDAIYAHFLRLWKACLGDTTCQALIEEEYAQHLETCSVPSGQ